jgi:glycosyltransferase involved in cell wall biosynthesis
MKAESQPLVSVLTPVYNGEKYLAECIESVLAQTYENWEYCIVNNCSTDRTLEIAQKYADRDKRIRIHNNTTFVGCDANGNIAFRQISPNSKYCKVVHGDDWLFPECIVKMVEVAEANPKVAIVCSYGLRNERVSWDGLPYPSTVISGREICRNTLLGGPYVFGSPTSMLIRSDEVRNRPSFYNEANPECDIEACLDILRDSDFGFVHQVLTFTREHAEGESTFNNSFGVQYLAKLEMLNKYGRSYLSEGEYEACIGRCWGRYYTFLGANVFHNGKKNNGFWEFHRSALGRLGYTLSKGKVAKAVLVELLDVALNPLKTSTRVWRKITSLLKENKAKHHKGITGHNI